MGVVIGKSGKMYILNLDNLGGYQEGPNKLDAVPQVIQNENSVYSGAGVYPLEGGYIYANVIQVKSPDSFRKAVPLTRAVDSSNQFSFFARCGADSCLLV